MLYPGQTALGPKMYIGHPALGTKMYLGLHAPGTRGCAEYDLKLRDQVESLIFENLKRKFKKITQRIMKPSDKRGLSAAK